MTNVTDPEQEPTRAAGDRPNTESAGAGTPSGAGGIVIAQEIRPRKIEWDAKDDLIACRSVEELMAFLEAYRQRAFATRTECEEWLRTLPHPSDAVPWLTKDAIDQALNREFDTAAANLGIRPKFTPAQDRLQHACALGFIQWGDPVAERIRAMAIGLHEETVMVDPERARAWAGDTAWDGAPDGRLIAGFKGYLRTGCRRSFVQMLGEMRSLPRAAVLELAAHSIDWADGITKDLLFQIKAHGAAVLTELVRVTTNPIEIIACLGGCVHRLPDPERDAFITGVGELIKKLDGVGFSRSSGIDLLVDFFRREDPALSAGMFRIATWFQPNLAAEFLEKEPLYRLSQVTEDDLAPLLLHRNADIRQAAFGALPRLAQAKGRKPPTGKRR